MAAAAARRFRSGGAGPVPLVCLFASRGKLGERLLREAKARAEEIGYSLEILNVAGRETLGPLLRQFEARGLEGMILGPWEQNHDLLRELDQVQFSVVEAGRHLVPTGFHGVRASAFGAVMRAAGEVFQHGYRRPVYLLFEHAPVHPDDVIRHAAAVESYRRLAFENAIAPYVVTEWSGFQSPRFRRWFRAQNPDVIIGFSGNIKNLLWDQRIRNIREIPFVNLHTSPEVRHSSPGVASIEGKVLAAAVDYADELIKRGERGRPRVAFHRVIEADWHEGGAESTTRLRQRSLA